MPPSEAKDNLIWTSLLAVLAGIGTPSTDWLTAPVVAEGIPSDALPAVDEIPRIYLHHSRTGYPSEGPPGPKHRRRTHFDAYVCAKDARTANRVQSDILRAIRSAEGALTTAYGQPVYDGPEEFTRRDDLSRAGVHVAVQPLFIDHETDHTAT
jgi:hypothetical protein